MRTFDHFPKESVCKICGGNKDSPCTLLPIDGTESGNNIEATPIHIDCLNIDGWRYSPLGNIIYRRAK